MAGQLQLVIYEGYLGGDPEMRYTSDGTPVTNFSMGSTMSYKKKDGSKVDETTWIRVTAWRGLAEIINNYAKKGTHVIVQGRLTPGANGSPEVYEKTQGGFGASYTVTAEKIRILSSADSGDDSSNEFTDNDFGY